MATDSTLLRPGPPGVHQHPTKREKFGTLTRVTIGNKRVNKVHKTVLLLGEAGTGKSTLINALFNRFMGVKFEDKLWYQIVEEKESRTSDVIVYDIFDVGGQNQPYFLTIIDTPGYGDMGGMGRDVLINQRLFDLFRSEDGVHELHLVALVMKSDQATQSEHLMNIFDSVLTLFGKNLHKNTVALVTHSDGKPESLPQVLQAQWSLVAKGSKNQLLHFLFDNRQSEVRSEEARSHLEGAWRVSERGMSQFTAYLKNASTQQLQLDCGLNSRIRLTAHIHHLEERIKRNELTQAEIQQTIEALKKHKEELKKDKSFQIEVDEVYKDREPIESKMLFLKAAVCCTTCEENCHYPGCTMALDPKHCEVMNSNHCTICTRKCHTSDHVLVDWKFVTKTRKVNKTKEQIKMKYEMRKSDPNKKVKLTEILGKELKRLNTEKSKLVDDSYKVVFKLDQTFLSINSVSTFVSLDLLIERTKAKGDKEKLRKLQELDSQMDGGAKAALQSNVNVTDLQQTMSRSFQIRPGPRAVYQLKTKKKQIGTLTKVIFGKKKTNKPNKTILMVGETGAGKSTLINALVNYAMGVKFDDGVWFQIVEDEKRSQTESQTSDVIVYQLFGYEGQTLPYSLTIIDTPGFGDTRGVELDVIVAQRLFDLFRSVDGVQELHAVGLVVKGSVNRLSDRLKYIFDSVMSLFGRDLEKNIVTLVTHSNGKKPKDLLQALEAANIKCAKDEKKQPTYFTFNNCQQEEQTEEEKFLKNAGKIVDKGMKGFKEFLDRAQAQRLEATVDVMNERIRLAACMQNLEERIKVIEMKEKQTLQIQEALRNQEREGGQQEQENISVEVDESYKEKVPVDGDLWLVTLVKGAVCCMVCEENCLFSGCSHAIKPEDCEVMKDGRCTVCTMKCPASAHVKGKWRYVTRTRKVQKTVQVQKKKAVRQKSLIFLENLEKEMENLKKEKSTLLEEAYEHIACLEKNALKVNTLSTHIPLEFLADKMKAKGDDKKVQKLKELRSKEDEGTRAKLQSIWGKIKTATKIK